MPSACVVGCWRWLAEGIQDIGAHMYAPKNEIIG
jgi:hypothetical protein